MPEPSTIAAIIGLARTAMLISQWMRPQTRPLCLSNLITKLEIIQGGF
jgi:hypothetical protein